MQTIILYRKNTQTLELTGLIDDTQIPPVYLDAATVTATLLNAAGGGAATEINALVLSYEAGSDGNYSGIVAGTFGPPVGESYIMVVSASESGTVGTWRIPTTVTERTI